MTPLVTGDADAGIFVHGGVPDKFYAYGGCPVINQFDVLEKTGTASTPRTIPCTTSTNRSCGDRVNSQLNSGGYDVNTMWFGFSFQYVRDDAPPRRSTGSRSRGRVQLDAVPGATSRQAETPAAYRLAQNFPNPFNPSTTIRFDMKEKGLVTLKIYNVAGQLVRTLVDGVKDAGAHVDHLGREEQSRRGRGERDLFLQDGDEGLQRDEEDGAPEVTGLSRRKGVRKHPGLQWPGSRRRAFSFEVRVDDRKHPEGDALFFAILMRPS